MTERDVITGALRFAKLQSYRDHHHLAFYRPDALPVAKPMVSKHCTIIRKLLLEGVSHDLLFKTLNQLSDLEIT